MSMVATMAEFYRFVKHPDKQGLMDPVELHAIYPVGRAPSPAARAFTQYLGSQG